MPKVLIYTDSPFLYTGMARVARELGSRFLRQGWEIDYAAWFHQMTMQGSGEYYNARTVFYALDRREKQAGKVREILSASQPDAVLCIGDLFYFLDLPRIKGEHQSMARAGKTKSAVFLGYLNVDAEPLQHQFFETINAFDEVCVHTEFGKKVLLSIPSKFSRNPDRIKAVHHGVDASVFLPSLPRVPPPPDFQALVVARNCLRKNIPFTIEVFRQFSQGKNNVKLFLVTDVESHEGHDLQAFITSYPDLWEKVSFTRGLSVFKGLSDAAIAKIYRESHLLIDWPMAEGFGLPVLEAMVSGVLVTGTDYSSFPELLADNRGYTLPVENWIYGQYGQRLAVPTLEVAVSMLEAAYEDWKDGAWTGMSKLAVQNARKWALTKTWDKCFESIEEKAKIALNSDKEDVNPHSWQFPSQIGGRVYGVEESRKAKERGLSPTIGVCKLGGLGDMLQILPVLRGIKRKHPNSYVVAVVNCGEELLKWICSKDKLIDGIVNVGEVHQETAVKTFSNVFDLFYDLRYVSRVYGEEPTEFFTKHKSFYDGWAFSNSRLRSLGTHVVDLMLKSTGLDTYASIEDLKVDPPTLEDLTVDERSLIPEEPYVVVHNSTGKLGNLKVLSEAEISRLIQVIQSRGYRVVQLGTIADPKLPGTDVDLRIKLSLQASAYTLSKAKMYVGNEGFWSHLAHSMGVRSWMWFTTTPSECFAYDPFVIVGGWSQWVSRRECEPCWWAVASGDNWWKHCLMSEKRCLNLPSPEWMATSLSKVLEE